MAGFVTLIIGGILLALYVVRIAGYGIAILRSQQDKETELAFTEFGITLLVPFRNEVSNLPALILDIQDQLYPADKFEVIFINDHSDDGSAALIEKLANEAENISLLNLPGHLQGKKEAISFGVKRARTEWIIQTDADCRLARGFISEHAQAASSNKKVFIAGPVKHAESKKLWDNIEALEFISLVGSAMGSFLSSRPIMCNGANISYSKPFYLQNENDLRSIPSPSGDDMFLLIRAKRKNLKLIYLMSGEAAVTTTHTGSFKAFLKQRIRWGSKARFYTDFEMIYLSFLILLTNGFILGTFIAALIDQTMFPIFGGALLMKSIGDLFLVYAIAKHLGRLSLLWYFPLLALFYYFYLVLTGILSLFSSYQWKGRNIKTTDH